MGNPVLQLWLKEMPVDDQFELAKALAANCGYQLVRDDVDIERYRLIQHLIKDYKNLGTKSADLIVEGLDGLLK